MSDIYFRYHYNPATGKEPPPPKSFLGKVCYYASIAYCIYWALWSAPAVVIGSLMAASEVPLTHWAWWVFVMPWFFGFFAFIALGLWFFFCTEEGRRS
jgi:hypothetical protein